MKPPLLLLIGTLLTISCSSGKNEQENSPTTSSSANERYDYSNSYTEIKNIEPTLERFGLAEYKDWIVLMDSLYEKDLSGIADSVLIRDVQDYDPVDLGWSDSYYIDSVYASSVLPPQGNTTYDPSNCKDFKTTAWVEGSPGDGVHESISMRFTKFGADEPMTSITIYNGFQLTESLYKKNSRAKQLRLFVNGAPAYDLHLKDTMKGQMFPIEVKPVDDFPITIKLEILSVYPGEKYADAAITDLQFDGVWKGI